MKVLHILKMCNCIKFYRKRKVDNILKHTEELACSDFRDICDVSQAAQNVLISMQSAMPPAMPPQNTSTEQVMAPATLPQTIQPAMSQSVPISMQPHIQHPTIDEHKQDITLIIDNWIESSTNGLFNTGGTGNATNTNLHQKINVSQDEDVTDAWYAISSDTIEKN